MIRQRFCTSIVIFATCGMALNCHAQLTKKRALQLMKENGFKWQQTSLLAKQAAALETQAKAANYVHVEGVSREFIGRVNQLLYGFPDPGDLQIFTIGDTALQGTFSLIDFEAAERIRLAHENLNYNHALEKQYQEDLTYLMLVQYLNVQRLKGKLAAIATNTERDKEIFRLAEAKVRSGAGITLDLMRARGLVELDHLKLLNTTTAYNKARVDLFVLIGKPELDEEFAPLDFHEIALPGAEPDTADRRPDVQAAKKLVDVAALSKVQIESADKIKLGLYGDVGVVGTHVIGGVGNAATGTLGIQLTIPLWDGHYNQGRTEEAAVKISQAQLQAQDTEMQAQAQVKTSRAQLAESTETVRASQLQIQLAQEELKLAQRRFLSGVTGGLELSNAQAGLTTAHDSTVDATFSFEVAKINYFKAVGNLDQYLNCEEEAKCQK